MRFLYEMLSQAVERIGEGDPTLWGTIGRTLWLAFGATAIALAFGLPLGVAIGSGRARGPLRRLGFVLANAGLGLPPVVLGVFLGLALLSGSPLAGLHWLYTVQGVLLAQVLLALPIVVALTAAAVAGLPSGLLDQARAFGARWPARAVLVLREARIGVLAAVIAALGSAVAEVGAVVIVGGNVRGQTDTLASKILLDLSAGDPAGATADVLVLLVIVLALGAVLTVAQQLHARGPAR
jgi:tungstate transport system permease protein